MEPMIIQLIAMGLAASLVLVVIGLLVSLFGSIRHAILVLDLVTILFCFIILGLFALFFMEVR